MNKTSIEWVRNPDGTLGYTSNPLTGCLNGCSYCYTRKLAHGRLKYMYLANDYLAPSYGPYQGFEPPVDPFYPRFWDSRILDPMKRKKPSGIFVCDMGDLFGNGIPEGWTRDVLHVIEACPQHRFYLLTKQPQNLSKFSPFPKNCWVGVTYTGGDEFTKVLAGLEGIEASVKFLSIEPLLTPIPNLALRTIPKIVDWIITGACTGTLNELKPLALAHPDLTLYTPSPFAKRLHYNLPIYKDTLQPKLEWIQEIMTAADKVNAAVFLKNNLCPQFPIGYSLRQEMPSEDRRAYNYSPLTAYDLLTREIAAQQEREYWAEVEAEMIEQAFRENEDAEHAAEYEMEMEAREKEQYYDDIIKEEV